MREMQSTLRSIASHLSLDHTKINNPGPAPSSPRFGACRPPGQAALGETSSRSDNGLPGHLSGPSARGPHVLLPDDEFAVNQDIVTRSESRTSSTPDPSDEAADDDLLHVTESMFPLRTIIHQDEVSRLVRGRRDRRGLQQSPERQSGPSKRRRMLSEPVEFFPQAEHRTRIPAHPEMSEPAETQDVHLTIPTTRRDISQTFQDPVDMGWCTEEDGRRLFNL
jgi:hypothetical protein